MVFPLGKKTKRESCKGGSLFHAGGKIILRTDGKGAFLFSYFTTGEDYTSRKVRREKSDYFRRVFHKASTEFWINNATPKEAENAIASGAVGATTNPTYPSKLLKDPPYLNKLIDQALEESDSDDQIADMVYKKAVAPLQILFQPLYENSNGRYGYVAIQGDPRANENPDAIIAGAHDYRKWERT